MSQLIPSQIAVEQSLHAILVNFNGKQDITVLFNELSGIIFNEETEFIDRSTQLDSWIEQHPDQADLADILFDLLMVQFLSAELHDEEYFDSPEWNEIENKTLDKGSEMLNLFLYLSEAKETEVEITMEDFLNEFLLVGEDEFQDEYRIYESLIVNEDLLDADLAGIRAIQKSVKEETGLQAYFVSLVLFFQFIEDGIELAEVAEVLSPFESAILHGMIAFNEN
jgi:hypothetical protein